MLQIYSLSYDRLVLLCDYTTGVAGSGMSGMFIKEEVKDDECEEGGGPAVTRPDPVPVAPTQRVMPRYRARIGLVFGTLIYFLFAAPLCPAGEVWP